MAINIDTNTDGDVTYQNPPVNRVLFPNITDHATPEEIQAAVDAWLEDHPEATTTVQDGSILPVKLDSSNDAADGYVLSWNATDEQFEWVNVQADIDDLKQDLEGLDVYTLGLYPQMEITDTAIASFTDGADNIPVKSLTVDIIPVQSGSGDPSPSNVRPISGWTGANVSVFDVNLFDKSKATPNSGINAQGEVVSGTLYVSDFISVIPDTDYYMVNIETSLHARPIVFYGADKTFVSSEPVSGTGDAVSFEKHIPSNVHYIRIMAHPDYIDSAGVNYPSTDHDYHAYKGNVYPISFPTEAGTVYGGTLDVTNGVLTVTNGYVDLGTLDWVYTNTSGHEKFTSSSALTNALPVSASVAANAVCEVYAVVSENDIYSHASDKTLAITSAGKAQVWDSAYTDTATFKSSLSGKHLAYELVTPVTYQLDETAVNTILGQNNIFADTGDIAELTYRADLKAYIDSHVGS